MMEGMEILLVVLIVLVVGAAAAFAAVELTRRRYDAHVPAGDRPVDDAVQAAVTSALTELRAQSSSERDAAVHAALQQAAVLQPRLPPEGDFSAYP